MTTNTNSRSHRSRFFTSRITFIALAAFALLMATAASAFMAQLTGAIYTTDVGCGGVNINSFPNKDAVYLNGGPQGGGPGLPEGNYYVRVTEPDGTPLGSSVGGPVGDQPVHVNATGYFDQCYQLSAIVSPVPEGPAGYNDTTNNGNEYKVWVCTDENFTSSNCKTDNFKVANDGPPPVQNGEITVRKFYDSNQNGSKDPGEVYLEGWQFVLSGPSVFSNPLLTTFTSEALPGIYTATESATIETNWFNTTNMTLNGLVVDGDTTEIEFGNYCTLTPGGHTKGYWSNKNGQQEETAADFVTLTNLHLVNADGSTRDFTAALNINKKNLNIWLLDANAKNMAYMLSAQLAATKLSVIHGYTNAAVIVDGTMNVNDLIAYADSLLAADGNTPAGDSNRAEQGRVKDILDKINNGGSFIQPTAAGCPYTFLPLP